MTAHPHISVANIAEAFDAMHWRELNKVHLNASDIAPVMEMLAQNENIRVADIGESFEGRPIKRYSVGTGDKVILAWTQMHGDEPTATAAVLDWLQMLTSSHAMALSGLPADWMNQVTLCVVPMLNPDGAQRRTRVNGQGIDINRDAKALQSPEGRLLHDQVSELKPDIAFNLHDQNPYYTAGTSSNPATIAFLAPAYHEDKHVDGPRLRAKQLIAGMADVLGHYIPGCIARYDDTYSFRSFGDNIAATGASTILIESGAAKQDPNRQVARKMNVIALQSALEAFLNDTVNRYSLADYYRIPENREDGLCDMKLYNLTLGSDLPYLADISILIDGKTDTGTVGAIGDLRTISGFANINGQGQKVLPEKGFEVDSPLTLNDETYLNLLKAGFSYFIDTQNQLSITTTMPVQVVATAPVATPLLPGAPAYFIVSDSHSNQPSAAVLNGRWHALG